MFALRAFGETIEPADAFVPAIASMTIPSRASVVSSVGSSDQRRLAASSVSVEFPDLRRSAGQCVTRNPL